MKKQNDGENSGTLPVEKPISSRYRETLFEIVDYGFGRRSCDIDSRFSLDARTRRINFDDPRMSSMVSVMEDAPAVNVLRSNMQIPVEESAITTMNDINKDDGRGGKGKIIIFGRDFSFPVAAGPNPDSLDQQTG
ncbi:hypothetical protein Fot_57381 [Forsythia ovata]|uniref:Uncharacterized protein n=1 Tax=Forsythia ovata TaxID=205694 RepID=A0ABD1NVJ6_9LAMI